MEIVKITDRILAVEAETSEELAKMFVRLQENYESPKFRNKIFTLDEFAAWYKVHRNEQEFTYYDDWAGFNVPSYIFGRFFNHKFDPLTEEEVRLFDLLKGHLPNGKYYVIAYSIRDSRARRHEIAHGLFYTNRKYKKEILEAMKDIDFSTHPVVPFLREHGYNNAVIVDEFHAWTLTDHILLSRAGLWTEELHNLSRKLDEIFRRYYVG